ncbi:MAG: beta strand repeat-containing protein [Sphingobacteriales bacterium]
MQKGITSLIKVLLILVICLSTTTIVFSQAPQLLNYQGVARNSVGNAIPNKTMTLRISIRNGSVTGSALYVETRQIKTNGAGLFATQIGSSGSISTVGSLSGVSWSSGLKFLQVELDPEGGSSFLDMGTTQLVSVPYALNADNATNVTGVISLANGGTGATSAAGAKTNMGLGSVDNTSDLNKPISTAAQAALNIKEDIANKSTNTALGNSDVLYPTQKAVKVYVDEQVLVGATPDATNAVKGKVLLAGDMTGTADLPRIANAAVTTAKVADASITTIKINDAAITSAKIADAAVTSAKITDGAITNVKLNDAAITSAKITDAAVTDSKIVGVSGSKITGNITGNAANITGTLAIANGGTGATTVVGAKTALALENVENTTDLNKPISTATQTALDAKENSSNKSTDVNLGTSDALYSSQKAVKTYVDTKVATSVTSVGTINETSTANGATITTGVLKLTPASATHGGVLTNSNQDIAGNKTFKGSTTFANITLVNGNRAGSPGVANSQNTMFGNASFTWAANAGTDNTAFGHFTLSSNNGNHNTAVGSNAMRQGNTGIGSYNVGVGSRALSNGIDGNYNTGVGYSSLDGNKGSFNVSIGSQTLISNEGNNNVSVGFQAGYSNVSGNNNTLVGYKAATSSNNLVNAIAIGSNATVTSSNSIQLGDANVTSLKTSGTITAGAITYPNTDGTANQVLKTNGNGLLSWSTPSVGASPGVNNDITKLNGLTTQKLINTIQGPINAGSYSPGDVVYDESDGKYYFFKIPSTQSSTSFNNSQSSFAIFDFGRVVIRIRPNQNLPIRSITLEVNSVNNIVLSMYSGLSACTTSACNPFNASIATVDNSTLLSSSSPQSGSGNITFTFNSPISITPNTDYYLTFSSVCVAGPSIRVRNGVDANFAISYNTCSIDQGIPAVKINYINYSTL